MNLNNIPQIKHTNSGNFFVLAGPCAIEGEEMAMRIAEKLVGITDKLEIPYVFKGSFKKANRSRVDSFTGIGDEKALKILQKVSKEFGVPTVTDIRLNDIKRRSIRMVANLRYKMNFYQYPYEIKLLQKLWRYRQPEIQGF